MLWVGAALGEGGQAHKMLETCHGQPRNTPTKVAPTVGPAHRHRFPTRAGLYGLLFSRQS
eukprot:2007522-Lingulodinium_polyedra.AAC.1